MLWLVFGSGFAGATSPIGVPTLLPAEQKIADAARIQDPALREVALRQALEEGLLESPYSVASKVQGYLGENRRWVDLRPFEGIIRQYRGPTPASNYGKDWVGGIEWQYLSRADRLEVCRAAIKQGQAVAPGGMIVIRSVAMLSVGGYGLAELVPLVEEYYPALSKEAKLNVSIPRLRIEANLKDGCKDSEECYERAAENLAAMSDEEFKQKMDTDKDFVDVLLGSGGVVRRVCAQNPFNGWVNPGCRQIHDVYQRQAVLEKKIQAEKVAEGITPSQKPPEFGRETWLEMLRSRSRYDERPRLK